MTEITTDLTPYSVEVATIRATGLELAIQAEAFEIIDDAADTAAKTVLAIVTKGLKAADARRVELKAPALAECKAIDAAFKEAAEPYAAAKDTIAKKTGTYFAAKRAAEEDARLMEERRVREQLAAQRKAEEEAAAANQPAPEPAPIAKVAPIAAAETVTRTDAGTVGMVEHRSARVVDLAQIPREYLVPDMAAINAAVRAGTHVPGTEVLVEYKPRTR